MPDPLPIAPLLLSEKQAALAMGGVSVRTMYALRKQGLPFIKIGGGIRKPRIMYSAADLATWIKANTVTTAAETPSEPKLRIAQ